MSEISADLEATKNDISALEFITHNIRLFMVESGGEDRSDFRVDLMKWESLLSQARLLMTKIEAAKERLNNPPPTHNERKP